MKCLLNSFFHIVELWRSLVVMSKNLLNLVINLRSQNVRTNLHEDLYKLGHLLLRFATTISSSCTKVIHGDSLSFPEGIVTIDYCRKELKKNISTQQILSDFVKVLSYPFIQKLLEGFNFFLLGLVHGHLLNTSLLFISLDFGDKVGRKIPEGRTELDICVYRHPVL